MRKCHHCGFEQGDGNFCIKCGQPFAEQPLQAEVADQEEAISPNPQNEKVESDPSAKEVANKQSAATAQSQAVTEGLEAQVSQVHSTSDSAEENQPQHGSGLDKIKEFSHAYWNFFVYYLKHPSHIFKQPENQAVNGLINVVLMAIFISLGLFLWSRKVLLMSVYGNADISFFSIAGLYFFVVAISVVLMTLTLLAIDKFFGGAHSFKAIFSIYASHLNIGVMVTLAAFILLLLKASSVGVLLLFIGFGMILSMVPVYVISSLLTRKSKGVDPFYGYLFYLIAVVVITFLLFTIMADSAATWMTEDLFYNGYQ